MARGREFHLKQNDTGPPLELTCLDADKVAVDVSGASVRFHLIARGDATPKVDAAATIVDGPAGVVSYQWIAADTDTPGDYIGEMEVTFSDGTIETFPNRGDRPLEITIWDDIA